MIKDIIQNSAHACVYPGEYEPLPWKLKETQAGAVMPGEKIINAPVTVAEMSDHYEIEVLAAGFRGEDFVITTDGRQIIIKALALRPLSISNGNFTPHGFAREYISREIPIPQMADTSFSSAEFKNGVLSICLFKTTTVNHNQPGVIIVY